MNQKKRKPYRSHSAEFKDQAVQMVLKQGQKRPEVARNLGISESLIDIWIKNYRDTGVAAGPGQGKKRGPNDNTKRIKELEKQLERVTMERDILKKAAAYFARESD